MPTARETLEIWMKLRGVRQVVAGSQAAAGAVGNLGRRVDTLGKQFHRSSRKAGTFRQSLTIMRKSMVGLAGAAVVFGAVGLVGTAMDFEDSMARVRATLTGEKGFSEKKFKELQEAAMHWGEQSKFSSAEVADGLYQLAAAGLSVDDSLKALGGTTALAAAGSVDMATAARIQATALNQFGLGGKDAIRVADLLTKAVNKGSAEIPEFGESLKYIGPVAKSMGTDIKDTITALTLMSKFGIKGSQAGTSLRTMFVRLTRPTKMVKQGFKDLGMAQEDLHGPGGKLLPLPGILDKIRGAMDKVDPHVARKALSQITGTEALTGVLGLVERSGKPWDEMAKAMDNSAGSAKKFGDIAMKTSRAQIGAFLNTISDLATRILVHYSPHIQKFFKRMGDAVSSLADPNSKLRKALEPVLSVIQSLFKIGWEIIKTVWEPMKIIIGLVLLAFIPLAPVLGWIADNMDIIGPIALVTFVTFLTLAKGAQLLLWACFQLGKMIGFVARMWKLLSKVFAMSPIGRVIIILLVLGGLVYLLWKRSERFRDITKSALGVVTTAWGWVLDKLTAVWDWVKANWPLLLAMLFGPFGLAVKWIIEHWDGIVNWFKELPGKFWAAAKMIGLKIKDGIVDGLKGFGSAIIRLITAPIRMIAQGILEKWPDIPGLPGPPDFLKTLAHFGEDFSFAFGGTKRRTGPALVGENGPELVSLPAGSRVVPLASPALAAGSIGARTAGGPDNISIPLYLDGRVVAEAVFNYQKHRKARR